MSAESPELKAGGFNHSGAERAGGFETKRSAIRMCEHWSFHACSTLPGLGGIVHAGLGAAVAGSDGNPC